MSLFSEAATANLFYGLLFCFYLPYQIVNTFQKTPLVDGFANLFLRKLLHSKLISKKNKKIPATNPRIIFAKELPLYHNNQCYVIKYSND